MIDRGVFSVARDIWDHPVLGREPFTKREAWMWLVSAAAWKPCKVGHGGRVISVERGEFCYAIRFLERKWNWKPGRVERFLKTLENHDMIRGTDRDRARVYSICKYNDYQLGHDAERDRYAEPVRDTTATTPRHDRDKEESLQSLEPVESKKEKEVERAPRATPKGTRWASDRVVPEEWLTDADIQRHEHNLPRIDLRLQATKFANYWASRSRDAARVDWHKTWINWALSDKDSTHERARSAQPSRVDVAFEAASDALAAIKRRRNGQPLPEETHASDGDRDGFGRSGDPGRVDVLPPERKAGERGRNPQAPPGDGGDLPLAAARPEPEEPEIPIVL